MKTIHPRIISKQHAEVQIMIQMPSGFQMDIKICNQTANKAPSVYALGCYRRTKNGYIPPS